MDRNVFSSLPAADSSRSSNDELGRQLSEGMPSDFVSKDDVAAHLLHERLYLTALEYYQELLEDGVEPPTALKDHFGDATQYPIETSELLFGQEESSSSIERVHVLEHQLKLAEEDIKTLKSKLEQKQSGGQPQQQQQQQQPSSQPQQPQQLQGSGNSNSNSGSDVRSIATAVRETATSKSSLSELEQRTLNQLIYQYCVGERYNMSALTFNDEAPTLAENVDELTLPHVFRFYLSPSPKYTGSSDPPSTTTTAATATTGAATAATTSATPSNPTADTTASNAQQKVIHLETALEGANKRISSMERQLYDLQQRLKTASEGHKKVEVGLTHNSGEVIDLLSHQLNNVTPSVHIQRRDVLYPLYYAVIQYHPDRDSRTSAMTAFLSLIRKPDSTQRVVMAEQISELSQLVGVSRTEEELLPSILLLLQHKKRQSRLFGLELLKKLSTRVNPSYCADIMLEDVCHLVSDSNMDVREQVPEAIVTVLRSSQQPNRLPLALKSLLQLVCDSSQLVSTTATKVVSGPLADFCLQYSCLFDGLYAVFLTSLQELCTSAAQHSGMLPEESEKFIRYCDCFQGLADQTLLFVMSQCKLFSNFDSDVGEARRQFDSRCRSMGSEAVAKESTRLSEFTHNWLTRLLKLILSLDLINHEPVKHLCLVLTSLCHNFGSTFTVEIIKEELESYQSMIYYKPTEFESQHADLMQYSKLDALRGRTLNALVTAVYDTLRPDDILPSIRDLVVSISLKEYGWTDDHLEVLVESFRYLVKSEVLTPSLVTLLRELSEHPAGAVRAVVVFLFQVAITVVDTQVIAKEIVPTFSVFASDPDPNVRKKSIDACGTVLLHVTDPSILDNIQQQLDLFLEGNDSDVLLQVLSVFADCIPDCEYRFREQFIFPRIVAITAENASRKENKELKHKVSLALLHCFRACGSVVAIQDDAVLHLLGGMKLLFEDLERIDSSYVTLLQGLETDMIARLPEKQRPKPTKKSMFDFELPKFSLDLPFFGKKKKPETSSET